MGTVGDRIRYVRADLAGMTQAEFSNVIRVSRQAVTNWERDKDISGKKLGAIADEFGISLDWLMFDRGEKPTEVKRVRPEPLPSGQLIMLDGIHPPRRGDWIVVTVAGAEGAKAEMHVGKFVADEDRLVRIDQVNPKKRLTFARQRVIALNRLVLG